LEGFGALLFLGNLVADRDFLAEFWPEAAWTSPDCESAATKFLSSSVTSSLA